MKKISEKEKVKWIKKLKPYAEDYKKARYYSDISRIENKITEDLADDHIYDIYNTAHGIMIRRIDKNGKKQKLVHIEELL